MMVLFRSGAPKPTGTDSNKPTSLKLLLCCSTLISFVEFGVLSVEQPTTIYNF